MFDRTQGVYHKYFHPETPYTQKLKCANAVTYGFTGLECREYSSQRVFHAEEYVAYLGTHCDHIGLKGPERSLKKERKVKVGALKIMALKRYKKIYYFNVLIEKTT